jgi:hypothetical protein
MQFFYDGQIRRYITQFIRLFSNFSVEYGMTDTGVRQYQTVPAYYGDMSRQVANIIRNNSENTSMSVPAISCYISSLAPDRNRTQEPNYVDKKVVRTRALDPETGDYTNQQGDMFTVERLMPTPFTLTFKADIWTSNTEQKLQLLEQILVLFNPSLEIQTTDNYLDWTSLSLVTLTDINFTSRSIPQGIEDQIDVASLTFETPIWITTPAKVKKLGVITNIINNITDLETVRFTKHYCSLDNGLVIVNGQGRLTEATEGVNPDDLNTPVKRYSVKSIDWSRVTDSVGGIKNGISKIYLEQANGNYVVGTVSLDPFDSTIVLFNVDLDSIPTNTLDAIDRVIDPLNVGPGSGLPAAVTGQRYLLTQATGSIINGALVDGFGNVIVDQNGDPIIGDPNVGAAAWLNNGQYLIANANDIIEFDGTQWVVVFDSASVDTVQYVTNLTTNLQYKWTGSAWVKSWEGYYPEGQWNLVIG